MSKLIIFTLLSLFIAAAAHADSLHGFIVRHGSQRFLQIQSGDQPATALKIAAATPQLETNLSKLKDGDFIVARGTICPDGNSVQIQSIESLGLAALVGTWVNERSEVYEFRDFSQLTLYVPAADGKSPVVKAGDFNYAVTPDEGSRYSIFVSNNLSVTLGSLEFQKRHLKMTVIDPQTGQVSSTMTLSPFAAPQTLK